uniref:Homing endonuclease LAGLIDADG domain-containing protein n=1 Tax=Morchella importuna TaxID=1174673 RepID=A0A650AGC6_9PEZI|nr:hypothetical protein [Morchella importuna]QGN66769.1 hypothetical protein [Morchella importuna]
MVFKCKRAKLRGSPKALVTKVIKETRWAALLMTRGKVISLEIDERKMGDRGSKSAYAVKEQRVDGSSASGKDAVRCTLVAGKPVFGRKENFLHHNHQTTFLYVKRNKFHSSAELLVPITIQLPKINLHPYYVTGLADGESSFMVFITKDNEFKTGWQVRTEF